MKNTGSWKTWKLKRIAKEKGKKAIDTACKSKLLHGQYPIWSQKADVDLRDTHHWPKSAGLKAETEAFQCHTQSFFGQTVTCTGSRTLTKLFESALSGRQTSKSYGFV